MRCTLSLPNHSAQAKRHRWLLDAHLRVLWLVAALFFPAFAAHAQEPQLPPGPSLAPPKKPSPPQGKETDPKKKPAQPTLWQRFVDGMGNTVPTPVRETWKRTKRNWERTTAVIEAMRKLVGEDEKEKQKRLVREKKQATLDQWTAEDQAIEAKIRQKLELTIHQQACTGGSANACLAWAKVQPKEVTPWRQIRDIWSRRNRWDKLYPICGILRQREDQQLEDHLCFAQSLHALNLQKEANTLYADLLTKHPKHPSLLLDAGRHALTQQDFALALQRCTSLTQILPNEPDAWLCLAQTQEAIRNTYAIREKQRLDAHKAAEAAKNKPTPKQPTPAPNDPSQALPSLPQTTPTPNDPNAPKAPKATNTPETNAQTPPPPPTPKPLPPQPTADTVLNTYHTACKLGHPTACSDVLRLRPSGASGVLWWSTTVTRISARNVSGTTLQQSCRLMGLASACRQLALDSLQQAQRNERMLRWGQAAWFYEQATQLAPKDDAIWKQAGLFFFQQQIWHRACDALERSLALQPKQYDLWFKLGTCRKHTAQSTLQQSTQAYQTACANGIYQACKLLPKP